VVVAALASRGGPVMEYKKGTPRFTPGRREGVPAS
jgi:hypothetical protein